MKEWMKYASMWVVTAAVLTSAVAAAAARNGYDVDAHLRMMQLEVGQDRSRGQGADGDGFAESFADSPSVALARAARTPRSARSLRVVQRGRLGNSTEDIALVESGSLAGHLVLQDGYEVFSLDLRPPAAAAPPTSLVKLFDVRSLPVERTPRGLAYIESEGLLAFNDIDEPVLRLVDLRGRLRDTRTIRYRRPFPDPAQPTEQVEGMTYVPSSSPRFPDHLVLATSDFSCGVCPTGSSGSLQVIARDGQVVREIVPDAPISRSVVSGVAFAPPAGFVVSTIGLAGEELWRIDFDGAILAGPVAAPVSDFPEGVAVLPDGRVVVAANAAGTLFFYDADLNREPARDLSYQLGLGLGLLVLDGTWDSAADEHVFSAFTDGVVAIAPSLDSVRPVSLNGSGLLATLATAHLADDGLLAVYGIGFSPLAGLINVIELFDGSESLVETIDLSGPFPRTCVPVFRHLVYAPATRDFAIAQNVLRPLPGCPPPIVGPEVLDRFGTPVRRFGLPAAVTSVGGVAYFDPGHPSGGQLLFAIARDGAPGSRALLITDFLGNPLTEIDVEAVGLLAVNSLHTVTSDPQQGAFAAVDGAGRELVVFFIE